ncbi:C1 family peptidase [Parendozoicomonas haliclonae]|uniref:Papain family cysteine protease n=2 Tax=Parendozoicomonas haliclonae TaxID=1960125 RepID=A0A1X7AG38_9GAMM|nr:Papain family cysteine protease [Parendozoicomonas haliclonae]
MSGTCWSFAMTSLLESELLRLGKGEHDLSEMYLVHMSYLDKLKLGQKFEEPDFVSEGFDMESALDQVIDYGMIKEQAFDGRSPKTRGDDRFSFHEEMAETLHFNAEQAINSTRTSVQFFWYFNYVRNLNAMMGEIPDAGSMHEQYTTNAKALTQLGINSSDYVVLTPSDQKDYQGYSRPWQSLSRQKRQKYIPKNKVIAMIKHALKRGYTVVWAGDVGLDGFSYGLGVAQGGVIDDEEDEDEDINESAEGGGSFRSKRRSDCFQYMYGRADGDEDNGQCPAPEEHEPALHAMHIVGLATDKVGNEYFATKNSWGDNNFRDGYLYMDEEYIENATWSLLTHMDAINGGMREDLFSSADLPPEEERDTAAMFE